MESEKLITLSLTEDQTQQLVNLIDLAVKTGGLQVAKVAVPLTDVIMAAVQESAKGK